jgi:hypothetical protein
MKGGEEECVYDVGEETARKTTGTGEWIQIRKRAHQDYPKICSKLLPTPFALSFL